MFSKKAIEKNSSPKGPVNKPLMATTNKNVCLTINPPHSDEHQKTVVVLGVERGGTSMAAGIVRALGVDMGQRAGLNHEDPRFITDEDIKLEKLITQRDKESDIWGFKMPKAVNKLAFLEKKLRNPYLIIVHRNLAAVADSWNQRGAGQYLDVIERALNYHQLIADHLKKSKRPALIVNYEQSVKDKQETVKKIAKFLGLEIDEQTTQRAVDMITGDGKGYVNLPEHFFHVVPCKTGPERPILNTKDNLNEVLSPEGWIIFERLKKKLILEPEDGRKLPEKFWLCLDFDAPEELDLAGTPLRIYFDYIGEMFPGHCARPAIQRGRNWFLVETSGQANAIGFGPLLVGMRFKIHPLLYQAMPGDVVDE